MRVFTDKETGEQYVTIPTRVPAKMQIYAKTLAFAKGHTMKAMLQEAVEKFFCERPWKQGLKWRPAKRLFVPSKDAIGQKEATGWVRVSMRFPVVIGNRLEQLAAEQGVPLSSICYTLMYWWTWWVYPPKPERLRREAYSSREKGLHPTFEAAKKRPSFARYKRQSNVFVIVRPD